MNTILALTRGTSLFNQVVFAFATKFKTRFGIVQVPRAALGALEHIALPASRAAA